MLFLRGIRRISSRFIRLGVSNELKYRFFFSSPTHLQGNFIKYYQINMHFIIYLQLINRFINFLK